ncbi:MAG: tRNA guanosine(15) transglycosylase TgtA [Nanopusillaceae archaeon]
MFEIKNRDIAGRIGILKISNKKIETPLLLPVINPKKQEIYPKEMQDKYKVNAIMTNAYIIYSDKKLRETLLEINLNKYFDFSGIIETDSGAYQILHYKKDIDISNKEIVKFQIEIGSNIINVLDLPTDIDKSWEEAKKELEITINRIREGIEIRDSLNKNVLINGAIQGGVYLDLRKQAAIEISNLGVDIYAIGTIVPYMIKYDFYKLFETIIVPRILLPLDKPVHLFGLGHPLTIPLSIAIGCDIFDSASYALYANDNRIMTHYGTFRLDELEDFYLETKNKCYHISEIKEMQKEEKTKIIAEHNLFVLLKEISIVKDSIKNQYLFDIILFKAHYHKSLYKATKYILENFYNWLKRLDPIRKRSGIVYDGDLLEIRTDVKRAIERLNERVDPGDFEDIYKYVFPFNSIKNDKIL